VIIAPYCSRARRYIIVVYRLSTRAGKRIFVNRVRYNSTSTTSIARDSSSDYITRYSTLFDALFYYSRRRRGVSEHIVVNIIRDHNVDDVESSG
jgi:hypothetical protein